MSRESAESSAGQSPQKDTTHEPGRKGAGIPSAAVGRYGTIIMDGRHGWQAVARDWRKPAGMKKAGGATCPRLLPHRLLKRFLTSESVPVVTGRDRVETDWRKSAK